MTSNLRFWDRSRNSLTEAIAFAWRVNSSLGGSSAEALVLLSAMSSKIDGSSAASSSGRSSIRTLESGGSGVEGAGISDSRGGNAGKLNSGCQTRPTKSKWSGNNSQMYVTT